MSEEPDNLDKNLLNIIQEKFPLEREPFLALGSILDLSADEVLDRIGRLKADGIIRLIGPVFNPKKLGYQTTLVAAKVPIERLEKAGQRIGAHQMVSHCYQRDHDFNLWFTLSLPANIDVKAEVLELGHQIEADIMLNLPAVKTYKIAVHFDLDSVNPNLLSPIGRHQTSASALREDDLSPIDRDVINILQQDLPLTEKPFDLLSAKLSMDGDVFLGHCRGLLQRGIMRRFSASINHYGLGFTANAMTCWKVPQDMVDKAGKKIANFPEVSHCYERIANRLWPYNLFAMIHAQRSENCLAITDKICSETGINKSEMLTLFSTKEVKKTRVRYKV
jgi:DNA-binding Lrp family transcriptional regulator